MYKVLCDGVTICDSRVDELALINPVVKPEENKAGSFTFMIPPAHPKYDVIKKRTSLIQVYQDEESIFSGICIEEKKTFYKQKTITCEGELTFFNDSVQRPRRYQGMTVRGLLEAYVANHNAQVEDSKRFTVGQVTVTDPNDYIYCYTNMETTMQALKEDLVDDLGGFLRIRHEGGVRYLDYLADSPNTNSQIIKIGKNLMDFTVNTDSSEIATAIIPLGCKLEESPVEGLEVRLTIESVNNGVDYVYNQDAVNTYGWIYKTVTWDNVTTAAELKSKGEKYLSDIQFENMVIEAKAIDLNLTDKQIEQFKLSDQIRVVSAPHGLDRYFRLTKMTINLNNPEKNTITLGKDERLSLSAKTNQANQDIKKTIESIVPASKILSQAVANATQLIQTATNGYVTTVMNEDGTPKELLIMDTNSIETATKVWRWNINGLGYSSAGYNGPYTLAMTMDGSFVADFIKSGTMYADRIKGGTLTLGGANDENGVMMMLDESGNVIGKWFNKGLNIYSADGEDWCDINDGYIYFVKDKKLIGGIGASNLITAGQTLSNQSFRTYGDVIVFSKDGYGALYIINPKELELTDNKYTEHHYFKGKVRVGTSIVSPDFIMANEGAKLYGASYSSLPAVIADGGFFAYGDMGCSGTKYRVVDTKYGKVGMNAFETSEAYFSDIGSGTISDNGEVTIFFDPVFAETVDLLAEYQIFLQRTSEKQTYWVDKGNGYFIVHGEAGATFDWMLCCKQKDYTAVRMENITIDDAAETEGAEPKEENTQKGSKIETL